MANAVATLLGRPSTAMNSANLAVHVPTKGGNACITTSADVNNSRVV